MGHHDSKSKSERSSDHSKKRHKHGDDKERKAKRKRKDNKLQVVDDDLEDEDMWVEKNIDMDGTTPVAQDIPTADSLTLTSRAETKPGDPPLPVPPPQETKLKRDDWMLLDPVTPTHVETSLDGTTPGQGPAPMDLGPQDAIAGNASVVDDQFSNMGVERKRKPKPEAPNPDNMKISSRELNQQLVEGKAVDEYVPTTEKKNTPGGAGSQWRMMRLRRVYETIEEEGKSIEEVAIERFGSLEAFEEAKEERRILDEREGKRAERGRPSGNTRAGQDNRRSGPGQPGSAVRYMFTDAGGSGSSSRSASFRRPDNDRGNSGASTPASGDGAWPAKRAPGPLRVPSHLGTPIPSVMTPPTGLAKVTTSKKPSAKRALSPSSLNKLQAKVLRAKLMGGPGAEALEKEYQAELEKANGGGDDQDDESDEEDATRVEMLPSMDGRGRLYDTGKGRDDDQRVLPGNRKKKEKVETRDPKTGEIVRYNADDDTTTLGDMLRQERFGGGEADQKAMDADFARQIMTDSGFQNNLDYIDDNAEKLGRKKMRTDAMKRQFAINDYKRTQKVMATCPFCYGEDDSPPKAPVIAMGTRAYLSRTINEELVDGHCIIVPIQHHLSMLEGDDDLWDEVKNFMKSAMRMFAEEDKGTVFFETVMSLKHQKHTFIECVPVPWEQFDDLPGYFKESIMQSELEWSQHKKLIDFGARPGGFRRAMVPNLPYFMVQFDYKGEKGYGHVIEGVGAADKEAEGDDIDEGEKGGGAFPRYFAGEIIGNVLELPPRIWRNPRKLDFRDNKKRVAEYKPKYDRYDWTPMLRQAS